jgi:hypothetical protein
MGRWSSVLCDVGRRWRQSAVLIHTKVLSGIMFFFIWNLFLFINLVEMSEHRLRNFCAGKVTKTKILREQYINYTVCPICKRP